MSSPSTHAGVARDAFRDPRHALCAGVTASPAMRHAEVAVPRLVQELVAQHPMGRMGTEEEIAAAVLWLCSPAAGFVTGTSLAVDGGFLAA